MVTGVNSAKIAKANGIQIIKNGISLQITNFGLAKRLIYCKI
jgi:hypothetical protein